MANIISVSALNKYVKSVLESDSFLVDIAVRGEMSNFHRHYKTGHCYFTLKDESSGVKAVMFRQQAEQLAFSPQDGMRILARCRVSLFERDGSYQLYVEDVFLDGVGTAQMAFEQLKQRLHEEGLFLEEHKKPLPACPQRVGLVTSKTGAALQDILKVAARRCPTVSFLLAPVTVQGERAADEIASAILQLGDEEVDAVIVARGGGSAEDLWVFNAEIIARAAFACKVPLVSAIGHEVDFTILDFVADLRAPTPSAAAEMLLPDISQTEENMRRLLTNIANNMQFRLDSCYNKLVVCKQHPAMRQAAVYPAMAERRLCSLALEAEKQQKANLMYAEQRFRLAAELAASLNPYAVLARGYSVLCVDGNTVGKVQLLRAGQEGTIRLRDGEADCVIRKIRYGGT